MRGCHIIPTCRFGGALDRRSWPADQLSAPVGHRPLRPALPLLHGRRHELPAQIGGAQHRGNGRTCRALRCAGNSPHSPDRRRAAGAARHRHAGDATGRDDRPRPRRTDADHQRACASPSTRRCWPRRACAASTSASTRSTPQAFRHITRVGDLASRAARDRRCARAPGLAVKINMVALAGLNEDQLAADARLLRRRKAAI